MASTKKSVSDIENRIGTTESGEIAYKKERLKCLTAIKYCAEECGYETVEACGEPGIDSIPCLSQKDIDILGLTDEIVLEGSAKQRKSCGCPANKTSLFKGKPERCLHKCLYCYWKD